MTKSTKILIVANDPETQKRLLEPFKKTRASPVRVGHKASLAVDLASAKAMLLRPPQVVVIGLPLQKENNQWSGQPIVSYIVKTLWPKQDRKRQLRTAIVRVGSLPPHMKNVTAAYPLEEFFEIIKAKGQKDWLAELMQAVPKP